MTEATPYETDCPSCGAPREQVVRYCGRCGYDLFARKETRPFPPGGTAGSPEPRALGLGGKSPFLAVLLAIIFPGFGHIYAGRPAKGLFLAIGFFLLILVGIGLLASLGFSIIGIVLIPAFIILFLIFLIPFEIWQCLDAFAAALDHNRRMRSQTPS